ncbi:hypothetical protein ABI59_08435 [Acidobacteria bacterium Mor1]|nr:hypothetical protein ABI59_08435 [Acidobacteria bacterium Mor1]
MSHFARCCVDRLALTIVLALCATLPAAAETPCADVSAWIDGAVSAGRVPVRDATIHWTGSEAIVWSGEVGYRFDPLLQQWQSMSLDGAPRGNGPLAAWTGSELLVFGGARSAFTDQTADRAARYDPLTDSWQELPLNNTPEGRRQAAAAWTGQVWIIWGGLDADDAVLGNGAWYNRLADFWFPTTTTDAPAARYGHSMTWTGSEVLLFGGSANDGGNFADLHAFDPSSNSWDPLTGPPGEPGRREHAAVWSGSELIVFGGMQGSTRVNSGWRYDPVTTIWSAMSTTGAPAAGATTRAVWSGSELIVWNGTAASSGRYDPVTDSWSPMSSSNAPAARIRHALGWLDTTAMVWGGGVADGGLYDPATDSWSATDPGLPTRPMRAHLAAWTGSEVLFWGGQAPADNALASGYRYSPGADSWTSMNPVGAPSARGFAAGAWTGSELIVWGGQLSDNGSVRLNDGGRYDPATDSWTPISTVNAPSPRSHHRAVWTGSELIVWGGWTGTGRDVTDTGGRYDPATDTWQTMSTVGAPPASRDQPMVWTGSRVIVWSGGIDLPGAQITFDTAGAAYDPATDTWSPIADSAAAGVEGRTLAGTVWTGSEMLVWGGLGDGGTLGAGGRYDPLTDSWTALSLNGAPGDRRNPLAVWTGQEMLIYGGQSGTFAETVSYLSDAGRYNPAANVWSYLPLGEDFGPRSVHAGVWAGDRLVTFGGLSDGGWHNTGAVLEFGPDVDADLACDLSDNCPGLANPDQVDFDGDLFGDACDVCPSTPDPAQQDSDGDGLGDACVRCSDPDGDGACDAPSGTIGDRCPAAYNPDQSGRKIVLSGSPFDGLEVTRSFLRNWVSRPLLVLDGDLENDGVSDLFSQLPLKELDRSSLGAAEAAGQAGYTIAGVFDDRASFEVAGDPIVVYTSPYDGGTAPVAVTARPGYRLSRLGRKVISDHVDGEPCDSYSPLGFQGADFYFADTLTGENECFGNDTTTRWISDDGSWLTWNEWWSDGFEGHSENYIRSIDFTNTRSLGPGSSISRPPPTVKVREDGMAAMYGSYAPQVFLAEGGPPGTGPSDCPRDTAVFSDEGSRILYFRDDPDLLEEDHDLLIGYVDSSNHDLLDTGTVEQLYDAVFSPRETYVAIIGGLLAGLDRSLYLSPTTGGPLSLIPSQGNDVQAVDFAPDGLHLYYTVRRPSDLSDELWRIPISGGAPRKIGPTPAMGAPGVGEWVHKEGRVIIRGNFDGATSQLYSAAPDGRELRWIELPSGSDSIDAFWTGFDGGIVLRLQGSDDLYVAPLGGGRALRLNEPGVEDFPSDPQIAEDGSFLIYEAQIGGGDRESVIYFDQIPDRDGDGILDTCDCAPDDDTSGQSPGIATLSFADAGTLQWTTDGVATSWTVYRGDLSGLPADAGTCVAQDLATPGYSEPDTPVAGEVWIYLVAGQSICGPGQVGPDSVGEARSVDCP